MALHLRFRFRPPLNQADRPQTLYIRLTLDGVQAPDYSSGIQVRPAEWDQKTQTVTSRSALSKAINDRLTAIRAEHLDILNQLKSLGKPITAYIIKREWTSGSKPIPMVCQAWETHLAYLRSLKGTDEELTKATLLKWENGLKYLRLYLGTSFRQKDIDVASLSIAWAKKWHQWLMTYEDTSGQTKKGKQANNTAAKYVSYLNNVLDTFIEAQHIAVNPLATMTITRTPTKAIEFLDDEQIAKLAGLPLEGTEACYRDLGLLAIYTGLDYPDILKVLRNLDEHRRGDVLVLDRGKKNRRKAAQVSTIPILPEVEVFLVRYANLRISSTAGPVNRALKVFASLIGFRRTLSMKVLRKTAGTFFLNAGYSLEAVSMILGHHDFRTTKRHYAAFLEKRMKTEMQRVGVNISPKPLPLIFTGDAQLPPV